MISNLLTISRMILIIPGIVMVKFDYYLPAFFVFVIAVITDFLDGFLARKYNQVSLLGRFLDPFADKLLYLSVLYLFLEQGYIPFLPVFLIIFREVMALGLGACVIKDQGDILAGKLKTTIQFLSILVILLFRNSIESTIAIWISVIISLFSALILYLDNRADIKNHFKIEKTADILNIPNILTFSRLLFLVPIMMLLKSSNLLSIPILIIAMVSDVLDGYVARKFNLVTNLGAILDPLVDKVFYLSILTIFVSLGFISFIPVLIILFRELIVTGVRSMCMSLNIIISANKYGKAKSFIQNISVFLIIYFGSNIISEFIAYIIAFITTISSYEYIRKGIKVLNNR